VAASLIPLLLSGPGCKNGPGGTQACPPPPATATALPAGVPVLKDEDVVATVKGQPVLAKEFLGKVRAQEIKAQAEYIQKVHQAYDMALKQLVMDRIFAEAAKKEGHAEAEDYLKAQVEKRKKPADDKALREMYAKLVPGGDPPFEQVKQQVATLQEKQQVQETLGAIMDEALQVNQVTWLLPPPVLPKLEVPVGDGAVLGPADAKVTIVEFSDFECPYCSQVVEPLHAVVKQYPGKVRLVFRHFPLSFHKSARKAALASACAQEQDKFWPYHDQLFKNQHSLDDKALKTYARVVGLDGERFDKCLAADAYAARIDADMEAAREVGVEGTPSLYINGRPYGGEPSREALSQAVEAALRAAE
jgi:protein-disulfide isomerase